MAQSNSHNCVDKEKSVDYLERGQWLRAAVLGANDGLVSTASMMMGVGAVKADAKAMLLSGLAALVAGALSMAIGEFVSVCTQRDIHLSHLKNNKPIDIVVIQGNLNCDDGRKSTAELTEKEKNVPNPFQAAGASAAAFAVGALVPLLSGGFVGNYVLRMVAMGASSSVALALFGAIGAHFGGASATKGTMRVLIGGWMAMMLTFGVLKLFGKFASFC